MSCDKSQIATRPPGFVRSPGTQTSDRSKSPADRVVIEEERVKNGPASRPMSGRPVASDAEWEIDHCYQLETRTGRCDRCRQADCVSLRRWGRPTRPKEMRLRPSGTPTSTRSRITRVTLFDCAML